MPGPEALAREAIDAALGAAGWAVQDFAALNQRAARGVAVREFPLVKGHGFADYLLYVDGQAVGVIEAKKAGTTPGIARGRTRTNRWSMPPNRPSCSAA